RRIPFSFRRILSSWAKVKNSLAVHMRTKPGDPSASPQDNTEITMTVAANIAAIHEKIVRACAENGRDPHTVNLVAVSKLQPAVGVAKALATGHRLFGENRVQETKARWAGLRGQCPDLKLHLIGPLQTNKAKDAVTLFDCIETVDRESLAEALAKE